MSQSPDWLVDWAKRPQRYDLLVLLPNLGRGGAQRVASLLIDAWAEQGYRICVATFSDKTEDAHLLDPRVTRLRIREFMRIRTGKAKKVQKPKAQKLLATPALSAAGILAETSPDTELATVAPRPVTPLSTGGELTGIPCKAEARTVEALPAPTSRSVEMASPGVGAPRPMVVARPASVAPKPVPMPITMAEPIVAAQLDVLEMPVGDDVTAAAVDHSLIGILRTIKRTVRRRLRVALFPVREAGRLLIRGLRTIKRTVRRRLRAALFPVREGARMLRRRARDLRRIGREARRISRDARRSLRTASRDARRGLRVAGRETRREVRSAARGARQGLQSALRQTEARSSSAGNSIGKGMGLVSAMAVLDWLMPVTNRLHFRGFRQCWRALRGTARDAGLPQRLVLQHGDLLTDRAKCRQVLAARLLMEHVQAPVTLAFLGTTNIVAALARHGLPTRLVISERNDPSRQELQPVWQELRPLMYCAADIVTANSRGALDTMNAWMPASRLAHVPNPLRVPPDPGTRRQRTGSRFISVGRLVPQKRVDLMIEAFAQLRDLDDWSFDVLGEGPERPALVDLVEVRAIGERVHFHGHVDPFPHLYAADIFVLVSDFEGMPNALLEAMACGVVPIVNDATPGPLEFVEHDRTGLVVPAGDLDALAEAMRHLACDELRRARISAAARERVGELAFEHVLDIWASVLKLPALDPVAGTTRLARVAG